ncbi:TPA: restriction endonuclease subunit S [Streptococcus suis]|uniref:restriction endonuclease subunit S n=1 Tax=Streptococcus suis TaxID=1307 RepID=UPI0005CE03B4|nr:restriction endonuclease subunit S [Streptococcus suis]NQG60205.1 restriction endonuclease subunit S [Streptococcus suis]CYW14812.1 Restriction endonuclease S subunit [Streptococcus suis]HEM6181231.1 restriction endonuclease subunit S [Streptococcus suis]HEM6216971.1 restriction endonuclease subunit S [Streptococcus suis]HEP1807250.1 restriction endonuclease subunit S [Streptococcus suis]
MTKEKSTVPRLRFPGFTDAWKQRKFSDLAEVRRGLTYSPSAIRSHGVRVLRSSNINEDTFVFGEDDVFVDKSVVKIPLVEEGDILITSANGSSRLVGKHSIIKGLPSNSAIHGGFMLLASSKVPCFLNAFMSSTWYHKFIGLYVAGGNGAIGNLNKSDLDEQIVLVPTLPEQEAIGSFFSDLDQLITLHQRKLDDVKELKKALLQKMFPKGNGNDFPELRFPEFTDAWKQRKLGEVAEKISQKNLDRQYVETFTNSAEFGIISQRDFFEKNISSLDNISGYYIVSPDDFVYNPRISNLAPVGPIKRNKLGRVGVMSPLYTIFRFSDIHLDFVEKYFDTTIWHRYMELNGDSGARSDRFAIKDSVFKGLPIPLPTLPEQEAIGSFFSDLDQLITLHQRQLDHLKLLKKALLQQMFI